MHLKKVFEIALVQGFINVGFVVIAFLLFGAIWIGVDLMMRTSKIIV